MCANETKCLEGALKRSAFHEKIGICIASVYETTYGGSGMCNLLKEEQAG